MSVDRAILRADNLYRSFGEIEVLKGVSLNVHQGDFITVVGASGAGKSSLLHILGGLDAPDKGDVLYMDDSLYGWNEERRSYYRNREIGFVFQFYHILSEFSALENVMMPCLIAGLNKAEAETMAESVLEQVGLSKRLLQRPGELSGGEQQRVAIARALVLSPKILFADEPTGNLDARTGDDIFSLLEGLNKEGLTMMLVTHNEDLAKKSGRTVRIADGVILEDL